MGLRRRQRDARQLAVHGIEHHEAQPGGEPAAHMVDRRFETNWAISLFGTAVGAGVLFLPINAGLGGRFCLQSRYLQRDSTLLRELRGRLARGPCRTGWSLSAKAGASPANAPIDSADTIGLAVSTHSPASSITGAGAARPLVRELYRDWFAQLGARLSRAPAW